MPTRQTLTTIADNRTFSAGGGTWALPLLNFQGCASEVPSVPDAVRTERHSER